MERVKFFCCVHSTEELVLRKVAFPQQNLEFWNFQDRKDSFFYAVQHVLSRATTRKSMVSNSIVVSWRFFINSLIGHFQHDLIVSSISTMAIITPQWSIHWLLLHLHQLASAVLSTLLLLDAFVVNLEELRTVNISCSFQEESFSSKNGGVFFEQHAQRAYCSSDSYHHGGSSASSFYYVSPLARIFWQQGFVDVFIVQGWYLLFCGVVGGDNGGCWLTMLLLLVACDVFLTNIVISSPRVLVIACSFLMACCFETPGCLWTGRRTARRQATTSMMATRTRTAVVPRPSRTCTYFALWCFLTRTMSRNTAHHLVLTICGPSSPLDDGSWTMTTVLATMCCCNTVIGGVLSQWCSCCLLIFLVVICCCFCIGFRLLFGVVAHYDDLGLLSCCLSRLWYYNCNP